MKIFVLSDRSAVECANQTDAEGWLSRFGAGSGIWREDSAGEFVAPDGQKIHASSLRKAHTQWREAIRGKSSGAAPARQTAAAPSRPTLALDEAGANAVYEHRAKIFGRYDGKPVARSTESLSAEPPVSADDHADVFAFRAAIFNRGAQQ